VNLEGQIELISVPQEFTRLCNAVLAAEFGDDFLPIDDDQADNGNDGYRTSTRQLFAVHCFKRLQKQSLTRDIRRKMVGDLGKAKMLKEQGLWEIAAWTFLSNYAIPEEVGREVVALGTEAEIKVSWLGPSFLAGALQRRPEIRPLFPTLQVNEISEQLDALQSTLVGPRMEPPDRVPRDGGELEAVLNLKPEGWEYLLFAGYLFLGQQRLELRWRDHEFPPYSPRQAIEEASEATTYLNGAFNRVSGLIAALTSVFPPEVQAKAFGEPGEPGDPVRIEHFATRIVQTHEELLGWAASIRAIDPPSVLVPAFEAAARMADQPLSEIRQFIDDAVRETDRIPAYVAGEDEHEPPLEIRLRLTLTMDEEVSAELDRRLKRANRKVRWGI
jgi:hypothetical protein